MILHKPVQSSLDPDTFDKSKTNLILITLDTSKVDGSLGFRFRLDQ